MSSHAERASSLSTAVQVGHFKTAPLWETATDPNGVINALVKNVFTNDGVVCIHDPEQSQRLARNNGAISRDLHQPSTRSQGEERKGSVVANDDASPESMTRFRIGFDRVTRVPRIVIIRQYASTRCRRRDSNDWRVYCARSDITLGGDEGQRLQGVRLSTSRERRA